MVTAISLAVEIFALHKAEFFSSSIVFVTQ
jgi:hypothetical protein